MKIQKQIHPGARQLLICFAGWSASPELFCGMKMQRDKEKTDLWICYDYRDLGFPEDICIPENVCFPENSEKINPNTYEAIHIVAWSLGVWVAEQVVAQQPEIFRSLIKNAVAINGTGRPIDDLYGIPEAIFEGTLQHLTPEGIHRFVRRLCGNPTVLREYVQTPPRPLDEIREELLFLHREIKRRSAEKTKESTKDKTDQPRESQAEGKEKASDPPAALPWTEAIVSSDDRIFPPDNLRRYWRERCPIQEIEAPHYPFYRWKQWNELWKQ